MLIWMYMYGALEKWDSIGCAECYEIVENFSKVKYYNCHNYSEAEIEFPQVVASLIFS